MKIPITILLLVLLVPAASALTPTDKMSDTILNIYQCPECVKAGEYTLITGQLTYADGTELAIKHMDNIFVDIYVNGVEYYGITACNATGSFHAYLAQESHAPRDPSPYLLKPGKNEIQVKFPGREHFGLLPSESEVYIVYVNEHPGYDYDSTRPLKLIGYAKGFFALSWFSMLFLTVGVGCISIHTDNPQTKVDSQTKLFFLGKVLLTVTVLFLAALFFAP